MVSPPGHPLYVAYALVMMLSYVPTGLYGYFLMRGEFPEERAWLPRPEGEYDPEFLRLLGIFVLVASVLMALVFVVGILAPKRPWAWVYKLVLICFGLSSCCTWPVTIPLLRRWLKPDMKRYYRMR